MFCYSWNSLTILLLRGASNIDMHDCALYLNIILDFVPARPGIEARSVLRASFAMSAARDCRTSTTAGQTLVKPYRSKHRSNAGQTIPVKTRVKRWSNHTGRSKHWSKHWSKTRATRGSNSGPNPPARDAGNRPGGARIKRWSKAEERQ